MLCHGFTTQAKLNSYFKCLENINLNSKITSVNFPTSEVSVAAIVYRSTYYGKGIWVDRGILLRSREMLFGIRADYLSGAYLKAVIARDWQERVQPDMVSYRSYTYKSISSEFLISKIDNGATSPKPLGGQNNRGGNPISWQNY